MIRYVLALNWILDWLLVFDNFQFPLFQSATCFKILDSLEDQVQKKNLKQAWVELGHLAKLSQSWGLRVWGLTLKFEAEVWNGNLKLMFEA